jgi:hypothetical protein
MPNFDQQQIQDMLLAVDTAPNTDAKGAALELLVRYLFETFEGVNCEGQNILEGPRAQELDLALWNDIRISELYFLEALVIVECKASDNPVSSADVGWFVRKLQDQGAHTGILVALNGITGHGTMHAHSEVLSALTRDKIKILLLTRSEIVDCRTTTELAGLLKDKFSKLILKKAVHIQDANGSRTRAPLAVPPTPTSPDPLD